ncbi:hypothetical protein D3C83_165630 [compost metagenome]
MAPATALIACEMRHSTVFPMVIDRVYVPLLGMMPAAQSAWQSAAIVCAIEKRAGHPASSNEQ